RVLDRLHASGAALHVLTVGRPIDGPQDLAITLDRGTTTTGGRYDTVLASSALTQRMKQVATELTHQYKVTYARPQSLIPPEQVTVSTPRAGLTARGVLARVDSEQVQR